MLNLEDGTTLSVSEPIDGIGRPTSLALDPETSRLYIGSERGFNQNDYYPLVAVDPNNDFKLVGQYTLDPTRSGIDQSVLSDVYAVYRVVPSETAPGRLFLGYAHPDYGGSVAAIFDATSGEIVGKTAVPITGKSVVSPDGSLVADLYPSGSRASNGETTEWPGAVVVRNIMSGERVSKVELEDNKGLQPPWEHLPSPFVYLSRPENTLRSYERDSGQIISSIDLSELPELGPTGGEPIYLAESNRVVLPMGGTPAAGGDPRGFVVIVDVASHETVKKIEVGPHPTNIVLAR